MIKFFSPFIICFRFEVDLEFFFCSHYSVFFLPLERRIMKLSIYTLMVEVTHNGGGGGFRFFLSYDLVKLLLLTFFAFFYLCMHCTVSVRNKNIARIMRHKETCTHTHKTICYFVFLKHLQ